MYDELLHCNVQLDPSRYPVKQERQTEIDVHYLQGGEHEVQVLFKELA